MCSRGRKCWNRLRVWVLGLGPSEHMSGQQCTNKVNPASRAARAARFRRALALDDDGGRTPKLRNCNKSDSSTSRGYSPSHHSSDSLDTEPEKQQGPKLNACALAASCPVRCSASLSASDISPPVTQTPCGPLNWKRSVAHIEDSVPELYPLVKRRKTQTEPVVLATGFSGLEPIEYGLEALGLGYLSSEDFII